MLSKEEFVEWKRSKGTEALQDAVRFKINETMTYMSSGVLDHAEYAKCVGRIQAFQDMLNIDYEEDADADSTVRTQGPSSTGFN